jgi:tetratricopeptide (TPR) repeat protein
MRAVMSRYFDSVRTIVERHGGTVEKFIGDAAMAAFGIPQQHEDDALRAVRAAAELRQAINGLNTGLQRDHGVAIQLRTAINTGEVVAGHSESGEPFATGHAINVAMKLHESAFPAEIMLGPVTQSLVRDAVATEPVDEVELGGAVGPIAAHRVVSLSGSADARRPGGAGLVGRREELERLQQAFEQARAENRSRVLTILGEAGVGKSRLALELASSLGDKARFVVGRCLSYGEGATYLPLAEVVRQVAPHRPRSVITSLLAGDEDAELIATRLTELTGEADGAGSTGEVFWAARLLFEALGRERPLVVVLEDVHWAEPSMLDLVEYLESWISDAPVLVICLARPSLLEERPGWGRSSQTVELRPLSTEEATELVSRLAAAGDVSEALRERIVTVAEGNALFLEQLHAYLTEDVAASDVASVPPTVEALLASRLDTLEAGDRALIERAAVIGRDFARNAVLHLSPPEELAGVDGRLATLERRGLVRALRTPAGAEETLRFHHVLIRDVAYVGITKERRADLHERHGSWLEKRSAADELVGYHAEQAHRYQSELHPGDADLARLASWAADHLAAAGISAWKRADTPAAVNLFARATALMPANSRDRVELLCELGVAQRVLGDFEGGDATLVEARDASARDPRLRLRAQIELAYLRLFSGAEAASSDLLEIAAKAVPIFEELGDDRALGRTWRYVGYLRGFEGRLADWQEAVERALVHYLRSGWSASGCLGELAAALLYGPTPVPDALERCEELLEETTDLVGRANVLAFMSGLEALDCRFDDARRRLTDAETTYEEMGELYVRANSCGRVRGRIEMLAGDAVAAERALAEACAALERVHDEAGLSTLAAELADALYAQGRYDEATGWLDLAEARSSAEDVSAQYTWRRVRAKALARDGTHQEAQRLAREAAELAARTDALSDHGSVLLDLAEVLLLAGNESEAAGQVERGLELFERKSDRPSAEAARALLSELTVA